MEMRDSVWLITGASVGFGRALAEEILARGGVVVATARNPASLEELRGRQADRVLTLPLDVTRQEQIDAAVHATVKRFGRIDVLVNNAGYGFISALEEATDAEARAQFEVNFFGLVAMTRAVLPLMREQRSGHIVNLSSVAGVFGLGGSAYYCASKFAVEALSESLAQEVAPFGIKVLIVEPGPFRTEFFGRSMATPTQRIADYARLAEGRTQLEKMNGRQAGDPARGAAAIVDRVLSGSDNLRLILGGMAFGRVEKALTARLKEIEESRAVAASVDYPA